MLVRTFVATDVIDDLIPFNMGDRASPDMYVLSIHEEGHRRKQDDGCKDKRDHEAGYETFPHLIFG